MDEVTVPETHKQSRLMFVKNTFDIFLIIEKKGMVYRLMTQRHYKHNIKHVSLGSVGPLNIFH